MLVGISVVLVSLIMSSAVYAPLATLGTGYAVTSNYEGVDVPAGAEVIITALTIDPSVDRVTFRWHEPPDGNGPVAREKYLTLRLQLTLNLVEYIYKHIKAWKND